MIFVFPAALAVAVVILWRSRDASGVRGRGCRWFWAWSLVGAALGFSFLTGVSIGLLLLPFALVLLWLVLYLSPRWPESIGFFEGVGLLLLVIAYLHRGDRACPANGTLQIEPTSAGQSVSCGGLDPHPWLYIGLVIAAAAAMAYAVAQRVGERR
jgi:hypothetical protein